MKIYMLTGHPPLTFITYMALHVLDLKVPICEERRHILWLYDVVLLLLLLGVSSCEAKVANWAEDEARRN